MQPHLPSSHLIMIFQSFCPERNFVKEVQARHIQMSCNLCMTSISSYHSPPPKLSSCNASMWALLQFFDSVQNFSLWSKYILSCSIMAVNLSRPYPTHITYLHQICAYFVWPFSLRKFPKLLFREYHHEGSTTLAFPNGMKFVWHSHMPKSPCLAKFQLKWLLHLSAPSWSSFWTRLLNCKATILISGPNPSKLSRTVVLPNLNLPDKTIWPNHLPVD